ncbi:MAG: tyrosine-type recombinase/integrase, partial [Candidatus Latescibacterota bacterium]
PAMAGVCSKQLRSGKWRFWIMDRNGEQKFHTGVRDRDETLAMARRKEDDERQIRLGYRPAPTKADRAQELKLAPLANQYLEWGCKFGGRGGRPWSDDHAKLRCNQLRFWQEELKLRSLADLQDQPNARQTILERVEDTIADQLDAGAAGKTVSNTVNGLRAFIGWLITRKYLGRDDDPLSALEPIDRSPKRIRRAGNLEELRAIFGIATADRRLLYATAFVTGLRSNELRLLKPGDADVSMGGLHLDASWTKNRKRGFQVVPRHLLEILLAQAALGVPDELYRKAYSRSSSKNDPPQGRLLYVPSHPERALYRDMVTAGVEKETDRGILDFHAVRKSFVTFLLHDPQLAPKEVQELSRHADLDLTMNVYGEARQDELRDAPGCTP